MNKLLKTIFIAFGITLNAFGAAVFLLPNNFLVGGVTGLGKVIATYVDIPISLIVGIMTILLFILGFIFVGKKYAASIVLGTILFPVALDVFGRLVEKITITDNLMLNAIYAGLFMGLGLGIVINLNASTGGSDVAAVILNKKFGISTSISLYVIDFVVMILQVPSATLENVLYGILIIFIYTIVMNKILMLGSNDVQFIIVSNKYEKVNEALQNEVRCGTTILDGQTGRYRNDIKVILCIIGKREIRNVKQTVSNIDSEAFITMTTTSEVTGRGFSFEGRYDKGRKNA